MGGIVQAGEGRLKGRFGRAGILRTKRDVGVDYSAMISVGRADLVVPHSGQRSEDSGISIRM